VRPSREGGTVSRCSALVLAFLMGGQNALAQQSSSAAGSPFALHAGVTYAQVPDADFETVGSLSGQDLFAQVDGRESSADFAVFVSQRLWAATPSGARVYATLGTGVSRPGRTMYLGGSAGASRALITLGVATALVETGLQPVSDVVFPGSQQRTLFGGLERRRHWGFFASVSFGLVQ